jgi:hypoxanthine phosphoribosyltransferase
MIQNSTRLETILGLFKSKNILIVDDINDSGTTLLGIDEVVNDFDKSENNNNFYLHEQIKYATLFSKESSNFSKVEFTSNVMEPDNDPWIVFPYEEWWK